ncbi:hypothetical protein JW851_00985 [Candidatus Woesearchaeota archaeon]|nr:hypothetical protein [Candidatus Woesearchaeota archaeon]
MRTKSVLEESYHLFRVEKINDFKKAVMKKFGVNIYSKEAQFQEKFFNDEELGFQFAFSMPSENVDKNFLKDLRKLALECRLNEGSTESRLQVINMQDIPDEKCKRILDISNKYFPGETDIITKVYHPESIYILAKEIQEQKLFS